MKKTGMISLLLLLLLTTKAAAVVPYSDEMTDLAAIVQAQDLRVENWEVMIREDLAREEAKQVIADLKNSHKVTTDKNENRVKYSFVSRQKTDGITEQFNVVIPRDEQHSARFIGVLKGTYWSEQVKASYLKKAPGMKAEFFSESTQKFTWLKAKNSGIINNDYFLQNVTEILGVQHVLTQHENNANSVHEKIVYGYTPLWKEKISLNNTPMNLQIAVKEDAKGNPAYIIGTPILIHEY
ncbi:YwmB family TATA-box binding protein [Lentibacillus sediminis]|uniref:YwmB family TATA-box binding protein n=1 Tax=Lentibacillus sediminis TaxID=1940529 RepID=UPI000C1C2DD4|nr:YwmB family TATA-box binding protein [Lentibacillus sediminis]